jgi:hypothetical protein
MGKVGGEQTLPALVAEAEAAANGSPDAATFAIIAGDFAYDLNDAQGEWSGGLNGAAQPTLPGLLQARWARRSWTVWHASRPSCPR